MKKILTKKNAILLAVIICLIAGVFFFHHWYKYRTITVNQEYNWKNGIGIRVTEYQLYTKGNVCFVNGKFEGKNKSKQEIEGHPFFGVLIKDKNGKVHRMTSHHDVADIGWLPFRVKPGATFRGRFDGGLKLDIKGIAFAVEKYGSTTHWIDI